ncbi:MAG TPA: hypothetical protein PLL92_04945, partial [Alicycliphilus sp.]|nr:hypothetical protein [Alicycliphilus sp.]
VGNHHPVARQVGAADLLDDFKFDEARQELRGERTGIRYSIGTRVRVQVSRVDLDGRKIDFRLIREGEELVGRALKDKGVAPESAGPRKAGGRSGDRKRAQAPEPSATERASMTREQAARSPGKAKASAKKTASSGTTGKSKSRKPRRS